VEVCVKYLKAFWDLVYAGEDEEGKIPVGVVLDPLLDRLDSSTFLLVLSAAYVGAVIDKALQSLAAILDKPLPLGVRRTPRQWWGVIGDKLKALVFSRENEYLYFAVSVANWDGQTSGY
jgi:hypothetical protein